MVQIRMERVRQHGSALDLNGAARSENIGTDIGRSATYVTDQDGMVWDGSGSVQRWEDMDIGRVLVVGLYH